MMTTSVALRGEKIQSPLWRFRLTVSSVSVILDDAVPPKRQGKISYTFTSTSPEKQDAGGPHLAEDVKGASIIAL